MQSPKNAAAGFGTRWIAYIIDCFLAGLIAGVVSIPITLGMLFSENSIWATRVLFHYTLYAVVMYCIRVVYFVIFTYAFGKTPGKMFLHIHVQSKDGEKLTFVNVLFRETVGRFLSGFFMYVGYLIAIGGKEHLALHDILCDTQVCYTDLVEVEKKVVVTTPDVQSVSNSGEVQYSAVRPQNMEPAVHTPPMPQQVFTMPRQVQPENEITSEVVEHVEETTSEVETMPETVEHSEETTIEDKNEE